MNIELPGFDFENPNPNAVASDPSFDKIQSFLDTKGVDRNEYALGSQVTPGFGELVIQEINSFWSIHTTERKKISTWRYCQMSSMQSTTSFFD